MGLPSVDFELMYWRARRRLQRIRAGIRAAMSHARADAHLTYLYRTGQVPQRPEPEDTLLYRGLWAVVIVMLSAVLAIDGYGEDKLRQQVAAVMACVASGTGTLSADTEALKRRSPSRI